MRIVKLKRRLSHILFVYELLTPVLYFLPLFITARIVSVYMLKRKGMKSTLWHEAGAVILLVYLVALMHITINYIRLFRFDFTLSDGYNLIPFKGISAILRSRSTVYIWQNILGNILIFMPLGFLLPLLWKKWTMVRTVFAGAALSFAIEAIQLFTSRGTDIDDLILNTLGTLCGYCIYLVLRMALPSAFEKFKIRDIVAR